MDVTYYPGCSLEATARDYDESTRAVCQALGIQLHELEDWTCCGATSAHAMSPRLATMLPAVNLPAAQKSGRDVLAPCPLCFNRLKRAQDEVGSTVKIHDMSSFLGQDECLQAIRDKVAAPLTGLSAVCYYGCMANRPPREVDSENYENPVDMDKVMEAAGVDVIPWSYKTDCCGASFSVSRSEIVYTLVKKLYDHALEAGAECIIVSCQMCQGNLDMYQGQISEMFGTQYNIPILYFTELLGVALGLPEPEKWLGRHMTDPRQLLRGKGLLQAA